MILLSLLLLCSAQKNKISDIDTISEIAKAKAFFDNSELYWPDDLDSTIYFTKLAAETYKNVGETDSYLICIAGIANAYYSFNKYEDAIRFYRIIDKEYYKATLRKKTLSQDVLLHLASYYRIIQNNKKAISILSECISKNNHINSSIYVYLGYSYFLEGDYIQSEKFLLKHLLKDNKMAPPDDLNIGILKVLGSLYGKSKKYDKAISTFKYIIKNFNQNEKNRKSEQVFYDTKIQLAKLYLKISEFIKFNAIIESLNYENLNKINKIKYLYLKAKIHIKDKQLKEASQIIILGQSLIDSYSNKLELSTLELEYNLAKTDIYILQSSYEDAYNVNEFHLNSIKNRTINSHSYNIINELKLMRKRIEILKLSSNVGVLKSELVIFKNLIKSLRQQNSTASHKDFWANENLEIYQDAIGTFIHGNDINTAFTFAEENKSNLLIQSLNDIDAKSYANIPEELLDKERELRATLQFYQKKKFELESADEIDPTKLLSYSDIITKTDFAIEAIVDTLETNYPEYYEIKYNEEDLKVTDVQELLDSETAFIEYFVGKDSSYVFTITKDDIAVYPLENISEKSEVFLNYYNSLNDPNTSLDSLNYYSLEAYNLILKDATQNLDPNINNLVIVPDDILNNLPFGMMKNLDESSYIGDRYNIQYQYSGRLWRLLKNRKSESKKYDLLAYAYNTENLNFLAERACATMEVGNLLCSEKEVRSIANILKDKNINLDVSQKDDILNNASDAKVIHLATHSCLDSENSDYSRIFFDDGYITNIDLQLQNINADLAVLSACESGYGELVKGEGAMSISKGFFHAGVKSTLVSLWPVDDCSTSEFMQHFYTYLQQGDKKDIALKKAKATYRETAHPSRTHPYYWAGFILIGDNAEVWRSSNHMIFWMVGLGCLLLLGAGYTYRKLVG